MDWVGSFVIIKWVLGSGCRDGWIVPLVFYPEDGTFQLLSINANGLRDPTKRASFIRWLQSHSPDIICIQESHSISDAEISSWFTGYGASASHGSNKSAGVCTLFKSSVTLADVTKDDLGRFLLCKFCVGGSFFQLANIYAPNRNPERDVFFEDISASLDSTLPTLLAGDFNAVVEPSVDRRGGCPSSRRESTASLADLFDQCRCSDTWRLLHPDVSAFSWTKSDGSIASRIDLFGCPHDWFPSVSSCEFVVCPYSDHCALLSSFSIPKSISPGPGFWKLNCSILDDPDFAVIVEDFWSSWVLRRDSFQSLLNWWDIGKIKLKQLAINFCVRRSHNLKSERIRLTTLASEYKSQIDAGQTSCLPNYKSVLAQIKELDLNEVKGKQIRSRVKWVEEGETSSAFFCRLEKKRINDRWFSAVRNPDGSFTSSLTGIMSAWRTFYEDLFTSSPVDVALREEMLSHLESSLSPPQSQSCEGPISIDEAFLAVKGMAQNKTPGLDGLPMEFYVKFWDSVGEDLVSVLNHARSVGHLATSQRRGLISLLYKKGDRFDMGNWRPITLLCVDYKIAARCIAGRLLKVISSIVSPDQTCGVPGRFIGESVALLRDVVYYASQNNLPVAILTFDQQKAFDRVEWSFLFNTLSSMGFGPSFISWIHLFYSIPESAVLVNGYTSVFFSLSRGVRQGCPLSPLLYVLIAEVLACNIRADKRIKGISLPSDPNRSALLSQYADDTSLIVTTDESMSAAFEVYQKYERASGAKLNAEKCKGLWLGAWSGRMSAPIDIKWSSEKLKSLGVFVGPRNLEHENWDPRLEAVTNVLNSWRQRALSLQGKLVVINILALSRLWYVGSLISVPRWVIQQINSAIFSFFWSGKRDLVARITVCLPKSSGGFGVVDVSRKIAGLHAMWVKRLVTSTHSWRFFLFDWFPDVMNFLRNPVSVPVGLPEFYKSVFSSWISLDGGFSSTTNSFCIARHSDTHFTQLSQTSARVCYSYLTSINPQRPHCEQHFFPKFGILYWAATWEQIHLFPLDRPVIDLAWKTAHGALYTAERLIRFGYNYDPLCFCSAPLETIEHLFFACPLAQSGINWIQFQLHSTVPLAPAVRCRHVLFGFTADEMKTVPPVFVYLLHLLKYFIWRERNDFRFRNSRPSAVNLISSIKARLRFNLTVYAKRHNSPKAKRRFVRLWGARGRFANLENGQIIVQKL